MRTARPTPTPPHGWAPALDAWRVHLTDAGATPATVAGYSRHLAHLSADLADTAPDPGALTTQQLAGWLDGQPWSTKTVRNARNSIRQFYRWALAERLCRRSPLDGLPVPPPRKPGPAPRQPAPAPWVDLARQWCAWRQAAGTAPGTVRLHGYYLGRLAEQAPDVLGLGIDDLTQWIAAHRWSPATRKTARSALRSFYHWAVLTGRLSSSPADLLPPVRLPRSIPKPAPESAYDRALVESIGLVLLAIRLAGACGLRRAEIAAVHTRDLVRDDTDGHSLRVTGKGRHVRLVPVPLDVAHEIETAPAGWLFPSPSRPGEHLSPHHLAKLVTAHLPAGVTTHHLRHRAATVAYRGSRDLRAVQALLGHSRPETTAGYVQTDSAAIRAAMMCAAR